MNAGSIRQVELDHRCAAIVALAHGLGLQVTAEGVETREQADHLIGQGCDILQGYVFARPMPAQQFLAFQQEHRADRWMN